MRKIKTSSSEKDCKLQLDFEKGLLTGKLSKHIQKLFNILFKKKLKSNEKESTSIFCAKFHGDIEPIVTRSDRERQIERAKKERLLNEIMQNKDEEN